MDKEVRALEKSERELLLACAGRKIGSPHTPRAVHGRLLPVPLIVGPRARRAQEAGPRAHRPDDRGPGGLHARHAGRCADARDSPPRDGVRDGLGQTFIDFPPMQKGANFNIEGVKEQVAAAIRKKQGE